MISDVARTLGRLKPKANLPFVQQLTTKQTSQLRVIDTLWWEFTDWFTSYHKFILI